MSHPQDLSLRDQAAAVASGDLDPEHLLAETLKRFEERDAQLNSIVATFRGESERMLADAPKGPLHGVPVAVKDQFQLPWRAPKDGTPFEMLRPGESGIYRRLRDAGAVVAGVANMHYLGGGSTGAVSAYGPVGNPWNVEHCGGGSSGGPAAAVGARLVAGSVGADGGGSIRLPAAYCGVTGIKPTYGAVPVDGNVHGYSNLDALGPFGRDAGDARLMLEVLSGRELPPGDASFFSVCLVPSPFWDDIDPEVDAACRSALSEAGWKQGEDQIIGAEHSRVATAIHLALDGSPEFGDEVLEGIDPVTRAVAKYALLLPGEVYVRADRARTLMRREAARIFKTHDLLAWPTVPAPSPPIAEPVVHLPSGPTPADFANVRQTGFGNLTGLPGINVPVGTHSSGLPIGLQLQAAWGQEARLLDAAERIEQATSRQFVDAVPPICSGT